MKFVCFWSLFGTHRFKEYGTDGGPTARALKPNYNIFTRRAASILGIGAPKVEVNHLVAANIALKGIGGGLFILNSLFGAYLLLLHLALTAPLINDFYNYDIEKPEFSQVFAKFTQSLALFGALLFYLGMKNSIPRRQGKKKASKPKTH
ncbi:hypothetical protein KSP39_PZI008206 [Platanthera zijinensis]|uniref:HR-like lesion-inducer n=1 Tax=Platanthera zijinensis TaxID=2320716 RepID=A0AAP0G8V1_9ASPA